MCKSIYALGQSRAQTNETSDEKYHANIKHQTKKHMFVFVYVLKDLVLV